MNHYMSAQRHQRLIDTEQQRMSIRRKEAMLEMCKQHGEATSEELKTMQDHIDSLKMEVWKQS